MASRPVFVDAPGIEFAVEFDHMVEAEKDRPPNPNWTKLLPQGGGLLVYLENDAVVELTTSESCILRYWAPNRGT